MNTENKIEASELARNHVVKTLARINTIASELAELFFEEDADEEDMRFLVEQVFIMAKQTSSIVNRAADSALADLAGVKDEIEH